MNETGEQLYASYRAGHATEEPPVWTALGELKRRAWCAWAEMGGRCQTGVILRHRPGKADDV